MGTYNDNEFEQQIRELMDIIEEQEFHDMESVYLEHLENLHSDLSDHNFNTIHDYINSLEEAISRIKTNIIDRFSSYNDHLTEEYLDQLIQTDRILFAHLNQTSKNDDCLQYLKAKEQYALDYKELLLSVPEITALSITLQNKIWNMCMNIAELTFLLDQPLSIRL